MYEYNELYYDLSPEEFLEKLKNKNFKYSRFNDGEINALWGKMPEKSNCDDHQYFSEMSDDLKKILMTYNYSGDYVLQSSSGWYYRGKNPKYQETINEHRSKNSNLRFLNEDILHYISRKNELSSLFFEFLSILRNKNLIIIGPEYLKDIYFLNFEHIQIPLKNCYLSKNEIIRDISKLNEKQSDNCFLFSASMATNVFIDYFKEDNDNTYLDCGSLWDMFFVSEKYNFIKKRSPVKQRKDFIEKTYKDLII